MDEEAEDDEDGVGRDASNVSSGGNGGKRLVDFEVAGGAVMGGGVAVDNGGGRGCAGAEPFLKGDEVRGGSRGKLG